MFSMKYMVHVLCLHLFLKIYLWVHVEWRNSLLTIIFNNSSYPYQTMWWYHTCMCFVCMCLYVCRLGYVLLFLYITGSQCRRERANDIICTIERADGRIRKYWKTRRQMTKTWDLITLTLKFHNCDTNAGNINFLMNSVLVF